MPPLAKLLLISGVLLVIGGAWIAWGPKVPWLGRLPGDIRIEEKNGSFYFPVVTCLIVSIVVSLLMSLFRK